MLGHRARHVRCETAARTPNLHLDICGHGFQRMGILELAVRAAIHGEPVANTAALANPEALDHFRNRGELL